MMIETIRAAALRISTTVADLGRFASVAALVMVPVVAFADGALTSAPVDYSVYRAGEVQRVEKQFEAWQLTCDEIKRLGRKFCSLRGVARSADGTIVAALTVSTDEGGRPAALVRLPFGTVLPSGLTLRRLETSSKRNQALALHPMVCDESGCEFLWSLGADDIRTLTLNHTIQIAFRMTKTPRLLSPLLASAAPVEGTIQAAGFAAALQASMDH